MILLLLDVTGLDKMRFLIFIVSDCIMFVLVGAIRHLFAIFVHIFSVMSCHVYDIWVQLVAVLIFVIFISVLPVGGSPALLYFVLF